MDEQVFMEKIRESGKKQQGENPDENKMIGDQQPEMQQHRETSRIHICQTIVEDYLP